MIGDIHRVNAFTIQNGTYHYFVEGIGYAESLMSAERGYEAYRALSRPFQAFLLNEFNIGLLVLFQDNAFVHENNSVGNWQVSHAVCQQLQNRELKIDGRPLSSELRLNSILITIGAGGYSPREISSTLIHELDHHFRFRTGALSKASSREHHTFLVRSEWQDLSTLNVHSRVSSLDPTYLTSQRKEFQRFFFDDMLDYMKFNHIRQIHEIKSPVAKFIFLKPMHEYFYPKIQASIDAALRMNNVPHPMDFTLLACREAENNWYKSEKPISTLITQLKKYYPALSLHEIREIISEASLLARCEIAPLHTEAMHRFELDVYKVAPRLTKWLNNITKERELLLNYNNRIKADTLSAQASPVTIDIAASDVSVDSVWRSRNQLTYNSAVGALSAQGDTDDLQAFLRAMNQNHINTFLGGTVTIIKLDLPLLVYRAGEIGKFWTTTPPASPWQHVLEMAMPSCIYPSHMKEAPNFHPANKQVLVCQIPAGQVIATGVCAPLGGFPGQGVQIYIPKVKAEQVRAVGWSEWVEMQRNPNQEQPSVTITMKGSKGQSIFHVKSSKNIARKGVVALSLAENIAEYGDPYAGLMATSVQMGTMRALQILAPIPLLPLTLIGALPDIKQTYDATMEGLKDTPLDERKITEAEKVNNILVWGNPFGPDRGLTTAQMTPAQKAGIVIRTDPEPFVGYHLQKLGQGINYVVGGMAKTAAAVAVILNPLSSTSKLDAPDRYRPEDQPGYIFIDALRATETKTHYQPYLVQDTFLQEISAILNENHSQSTDEHLPPIEHPIDPQRLQLAATLAPGYVGPKFHFKDDKLPQWMQGVGVVGSLGTGWKAFVGAQLSWATFGVGLALLTVTEVVLHFMRKHELSKQKRRARNTGRVNKQCTVIDNDINKVTICIDAAIALANNYLSETDPVMKQAYFTQFSKVLVEASAENKAQHDLNCQRMQNKEAHIEGHKIRLRSRRHCGDIHFIFAENTKLIDEMDDIIILNLNYDALRGRGAVETNPDKLASINLLLAAHESRLSEADIASVHKYLSEKKFDEAMQHCDNSQHLSKENKASLQNAILQKKESVEKGERVALSITRIDEALLGNDFDLAAQYCTDSEISLELKSDILVDIKAQKIEYLDHRFTIKLTLGGDVAGLVKNTLTLFTPAKKEPLISIPMTKRDGVKVANMGLWQQAITVERGQPVAREMNTVKRLPAVISGERVEAKKSVRVLKL